MELIIFVLDPVKILTCLSTFYFILQIRNKEVWRREKIAGEKTAGNKMLGNKKRLQWL